MFWNAGCSFLRTEGFFFSLFDLYEGLRISKLQIFYKEHFQFFSAVNFFQFLVIKTLDSELELTAIHLFHRLGHILSKPSVADPDPEAWTRGSGSTPKCHGSATLSKSAVFYLFSGHGVQLASRCSPAWFLGREPLLSHQPQGIITIKSFLMLLNRPNLFLFSSWCFGIALFYSCFLAKNESSLSPAEIFCLLVSEKDLYRIGTQRTAMTARQAVDTYLHLAAHLCLLLFTSMGKKSVSLHNVPYDWCFE